MITIMLTIMPLFPINMWWQLEFDTGTGLPWILWVLWDSGRKGSEVLESYSGQDNLLTLVPHSSYPVTTLPPMHLESHNYTRPNP